MHVSIMYHKLRLVYDCMHVDVYACMYYDSFVCLDLGPIICLIEGAQVVPVVDV